MATWLKHEFLKAIQVSSLVLMHEKYHYTHAVCGIIADLTHQQIRKDEVVPTMQLSLVATSLES